ncbi:MAG: hypothetical protein ACRDRN_07390 [Sciscionella sp.]
MDEILFGVLAEAIREYLDTVDRGTSDQDARRLVAAWRALLGMHKESGRGCRECRRSRGSLCGVWRVAVGYFLHRTPGDR